MGLEVCTQLGTRWTGSTLDTVVAALISVEFLFEYLGTAGSRRVSDYFMWTR